MRIFIDFYYDPSNRLDMRNKVIYRVTSKRQAVQSYGDSYQSTPYAGYYLDYSYHQTAGKRFQMSTVSDTNCRTAMVAPAASDSIREAHSYEYDNNGNILYVNTSRVKPDMTVQPDTVQRARDERCEPPLPFGKRPLKKYRQIIDMLHDGYIQT